MTKRGELPVVMGSGTAFHVHSTLRAVGVQGKTKRARPHSPYPLKTSSCMHRTSNGLYNHPAILPILKREQGLDFVEPSEEFGGYKDAYVG